jgi:hypothetical protein
LSWFSATSLIIHTTSACGLAFSAIARWTTGPVDRLIASTLIWGCALAKAAMITFSISSLLAV